MTQPQPEDLKQRVSELSTLVAGYVGYRTAQIGLQHGIFDELGAHPDGLGLDDLAARTGMDRFYLEVWCRSAYAAGLIEGDPEGYRLDPVTATILTDRSSPAYLGGLLTILDEPEMFDRFTERLPSGERTWWDQVGQGFIRGVANTSRPAYLRLIPSGLARIPGLDAALEDADVVDLACGTGFGLVQLARNYPSARLTGVDGDAYSLDLARGALDEEGIVDRVELVHSTLEDFERRDAFDMVTINLSMHECRDIDKVTENVRNALRPQGTFVISDFPFPDNPQGLRSVPGRIMSGIQFFEAQIDDQLLPTQAFVDLLAKHGFEAVDSFELSPTHAVTHGRAPAA